MLLGSSFLLWLHQNTKCFALTVCCVGMQWVRFASNKRGDVCMRTLTLNVLHVPVNQNLKGVSGRGPVCCVCWLIRKMQ